MLCRMLVSLVLGLSLVMAHRPALAQTLLWTFPRPMEPAPQSFRVTARDTRTGWMSEVMLPAVPVEACAAWQTEPPDPQLFCGTLPQCLEPGTYSIWLSAQWESGAIRHSREAWELTMRPECTVGTLKPAWSAERVQATPRGLGQGIDYDVDGVHRPQGSAWDIGAYEFGGAVLPPQRLAWWKFEETGGTAVDSSGNSNDGTFVGGPTVVPGRVGLRARQFNGATQYLERAAFTGLTAYTWVGWFQFTTLCGSGLSQPLIGATDSEPFGFSCNHNQATFVRAAQHRDASSNFYSAQVPFPLPTDRWWRLAATYDSTTGLTMVVNGTVVATTPVTSIIAPTGTFRLGSAGDLSKAWAGKVDHFSLDNYAQTATALYTDYRQSAQRMRHGSR